METTCKPTQGLVKFHTPPHPPPPPRVSPSSIPLSAMDLDDNTTVMFLNSLKLVVSQTKSLLFLSRSRHLTLNRVHHLFPYPRLSLVIINLESDNRLLGMIRLYLKLTLLFVTKFSFLLLKSLHFALNSSLLCCALNVSFFIEKCCLCKYLHMVGMLRSLPVVMRICVVIHADRVMVDLQQLKLL